ncbi:group-specific protein [Bacillus sp. AFS041924]|uniref:group-specific protein n=1 Tax=Bacillus sp. AFS041924 TaxID=2033503 RepID=UPI000BFC6829|nr:group-specific protein [Bacillus sp. AFS041924]PGS48468.1 group-specific protein [Bacillus sp. AFS041924]
MGKCNLNHSKKDVQDKLDFQRNYLPDRITDDLDLLLRTECSQEILNEIFHLIKKYDLSTNAEQELRNKRLSDLLSI